MNIDNKEIKHYFDRKTMCKFYGYDVDKERDFIIEQAQPIHGRILEVGTGKGHCALALAKAGYHFVTFDISDNEQHFAKFLLAYFGFEKSVDFRIENAEHTHFADKSFDTIISVNVLHHLQQPYRVIDELLRLKSGKGKIIIADFTTEGFKVMDIIHRTEGNVHEVCMGTLTNVEAYFVQKGFSVTMEKSTYQCVLIAQER